MCLSTGKWVCLVSSPFWEGWVCLVPCPFYGGCGYPWFQVPSGGGHTRGVDISGWVYQGADLPRGWGGYTWYTPLVLTSSDGHWSGWCASYWNAALLWLLLQSCYFLRPSNSFCLGPTQLYFVAIHASVFDFKWKQSWVTPFARVRLISLQNFVETIFYNKWQ